MRKRWMIAGAVSALMTGGAIAQERRQMVFTQAVPAPPGAGPASDEMFFSTATMAGGTVQFMSAEMGFEGAVVKGAPYSAESVNETTQTLSDGNRITHKTSSSIYRDSEGRTRREQSLPAIGPWATSGTPEVTVFINDPVSGVNYMLDSNTKTARKMAAGKFSRGIAMAQPSTSFKQPGVAFRKEGAIQATATQPKEEKLPSQLIEGVQAEGTRTTITIPAGEMGNERPIEIVSERWYSPELKTVVMSKHKDPRMGETVYKLTGIQRAEPSRSLFEVPSDYTIADDSGPDMMRTKKLIREKMVLDHEE